MIYRPIVLDQLKYKFNMHAFLFKLYVLISFSSGLISTSFESPIVRSLDDLVFVTMLITVFQTGALKAKRILLPSLWLPALTVFSCVIAVMQDNTFNSVLLSLRQYKNVFLIFLMVGLKRDYLQFVWTVIKWSLWVSLPVTIYQFFTAANADDITGIFGFGGSGTLSILIVFYLTSEFTIRTIEGRSRIGWYLLLFTPCLINETKITFILLPLSVVISLFSVGKLKIRTLLSIVAVGSISILSADILYQALYERSYVDFFTPEKLDKYFYEDGDGSDLGRLLRVSMAYDYISKKGLETFMFGQGLGASFAGIYSDTYGVAAENLKWTGLNEGSRVQLYHFIIDFGLAGTVLFISAFLFYLRSALKNKKNDIRDVYGIVMVVIFLVGIIYQNILINKALSLLLFFYMYSSTFCLRKISN